MTVTVEISDSVKGSLEKVVGEQGVEPLRQAVEKLINKALKGMADNGDADAKDLFESGQILSILCLDELQAKALGLEKSDFSDLMWTYGGGYFGKTKGKYDGGKPAKGRVAAIALNNDKLAEFGFFRKFDAFSAKPTMWRIFVHETLHAAAEKNAEHKDQDLDKYEKWEKNAETASGAAASGREVQDLLAEIEETRQRIRNLESQLREVLSFLRLARGESWGDNTPEVLKVLAETRAKRKDLRAKLATLEKKLKKLEADLKALLKNL